jgi:hypothetical protein
LFELQILSHAATLQRSLRLLLPPGVIPSSRRSIDLGSAFRLSAPDCCGSNCELYIALYIVCLFTDRSVVSNRRTTFYSDAS